MSATFTFTILEDPPVAETGFLATEAAAAAAVSARAEAAVIRLLAEDSVISGGIPVEVFARSQPMRRGYRGAAVEGWRLERLGEPDGWGDYEAEFACRLGVRLSAAPGFNVRRNLKFRATLRSPEFAVNRCRSVCQTAVVSTEGLEKAAASYVRRALPWLRLGAVYSGASAEEKALLDSQDYGVEWKTGQIVYEPI